VDSLSKVCPNRTPIVSQSLGVLFFSCPSVGYNPGQIRKVPHASEK
jgi:hypothetical protein